MQPSAHPADEFTTVTGPRNSRALANPVGISLGSLAKKVKAL